MPFTGTMQLETGSTPAPGVPALRPRRAVPQSMESLNNESVWTAQEMIGKGASHDARGERAPLPDHDSGLGWL